RVGPPPDLLSDTYTNDYNEDKNYGAAVGGLANATQKENGRFFADSAVAQTNRALRRYAINNTFSLVATARFFAMVTATIVDSQIACWDSKYTYGFWRPVSAIRLGDTFGNPNTPPDPNWLSLVATPPHPEYPAAHGCWTNSVGTQIGNFMGTTNINFSQ